MSALIKPARQNQVFCTTVDRNGGWQSQLQLSSTIRTKPNGLAGIQLDGNAATGDFALSLSPANLTAARRWSFPDRSDTVAGLGAQTFTGAQTVSSTLSVTGVLTTSSKISISGSGSTPTSTLLEIGTNAAGTRWRYNAPSGGEHDFDIAGATAVYVTATATGILSTDDATSTTAAALVVSGGVGIAKALIIGGALTVNSATLIKSNTTLTDGAGAAAGTLLNAPTAGNPTKWCLINDNGTIRKFPTWT